MLEDNVQKDKGASNRNKITKRYVALKSGCLSKVVAAVLELVIGCLLLGKVFAQSYQSPFLNAVCATLAIVLICFALIIGLKNFSLLLKIIRIKYTIQTPQILSITFKHKYKAADCNEMVLGFKRFKLTVSDAIAEKLNVGDKVLLVFADDVKYPIIIEKCV